MQLSRSESKCRKKFIAEHHYNKQQARLFDEAVSYFNMRYKDAYAKNNDWFVQAYHLRKQLEKFDTQSFVDYMSNRLKDNLRRLSERLRNELKRISEEESQND